MKIQSLVVVIATVLLTACGNKHEHVQAVDKLAEAKEVALAKAPKAEEIKFDDHGQPTFAQTSGASTATTADADTATTEQKK
ncbi:MULTISPECIES: hypothetical protein [unclassified Moraxella]|uniref:hypothetical protein n=1 Tax=unclassified Moraxella TaxID=2685852 RepID=UPI002B40F5EF|nr:MULTISPECIES: hypothetical protein [unclassified Moraxella]